MIFDELEYFANLCNETKRANFTITRNVKTRMWRVRVNRQHFIDVSLTVAIHKASKYVFAKRTLTTNRKL